MPKPEVNFVSEDKGLLIDNGKFKERILAYDSETGNYTKIQYIPAGYVEAANGHKHDDYWEEIYVLEGEIYDEHQQKWIVAGDYACRPPGVWHGPFRTKPDVHFKTIQMITYNWRKPTPVPAEGPVEKEEGRKADKGINGHSHAVANGS